MAADSEDLQATIEQQEQRIDGLLRCVDALTLIDEMLGTVNDDDPAHTFHAIEHLQAEVAALTARCQNLQQERSDFEARVTEELDRVMNEKEVALRVLATNSGLDLVDACKQVKQVAISEADNSEQAEAQIEALTARCQHLEKKTEQLEQDVKLFNDGQNAWAFKYATVFTEAEALTARWEFKYGMATAQVSALAARCRGLEAERDAYRRAATQMHNGLVGAGSAGLFNSALAEDGVRLFDEAELLADAPLFADDAVAIRSWKGKYEAAEAQAEAFAARCRELEAQLAEKRLQVESLSMVQARNDALAARCATLEARLKELGE